MYYAKKKIVAMNRFMSPVQWTFNKYIVISYDIKTIVLKNFINNKFLNINWHYNDY